MSDTKEILNFILNDEKLLNSKAFKDRVYKDEPIIRPASQLKKAQPLESAGNKGVMSAPEKIREMRNLAYTPEAHWKTSAWLFYTQGKFMEDYEDSYDYNNNSSGFITEYPVYRDMTAEQLRGYFSWRTSFRIGDYKPAPVPFVYLYIFEIINQIGVDSVSDGFEKLKIISEKYGYMDRRLKNRLIYWRNDYVIYYGLDPSLLENNLYASLSDFCCTLINYKSASEDELFSAIVNVSSYKIKESIFYKKYPEEFKTAACRTIYAVSDYYEKKRKKRFTDTLIEEYHVSYHIFDSAVFYNRDTERNFVYNMSETIKVVCVNGICRRESMYIGKKGSNKIGEIMRTVEFFLRDRLKFKYKIKCGKVTKGVLAAIQQTVDEICEQNKKSETVKIEIDVSKLGNIRKAADITREKLIIDEGEIHETIPEVPENTEGSTEKVPENSTPLNEAEYKFMQALLYGGDCNSVAKQYDTMSSLLSDSVNEKLFDLFGDTVIDFSNDCPEIIEDYADELKGMIVQ